MGKDDDNCSQCHGEGEIVVWQDDDENEQVKEYKVTCPLCGGTGKGS